MVEDVAFFVHLREYALLHFDVTFLGVYVLEEST